MLLMHVDAGGGGVGGHFIAVAIGVVVSGGGGC